MHWAQNLVQRIQREQRVLFLSPGTQVSGGEGDFNQIEQLVQRPEAGESLEHLNN
jgi:hypothetical protein